MSPSAITKPQGMGQPGGIIEREATIHLSNLMLVDPDEREARRGSDSGNWTMAARCASRAPRGKVIEG